MLVLDDHHLFVALSGNAPPDVLRALAHSEVFTTASWYYRLARAANDSTFTGALSRRIESLESEGRDLIMNRLDQLPVEIGLRSRVEDLRDELDEYEQLRDGTTRTIRAGSLAELADALIKTRVARGWTQADLGAALGVAEQQIQRYEASRYAAASLARLCDIADALHVTVEETLTLQAS